MANDINNYYRVSSSIIQQAERLSSNQQKQTPNTNVAVNSDFKDLFQQEVEKTVTFSKHAAQRSEQRSIEVSESDLEKISQACDQAQEKGINNALIMMDDSAFIVSAQNRRVITVMDKNEMKEKIVNDIDGAIFI
ncbi:TIGR02530 family flagellar biosynthesis protein [Eubacteriaceae bacterium ES2]|nr:TIGR02530 family flagellar biosynthesis protein [Eubacteriaceae bacterium ES2]